MINCGGFASKCTLRWRFAIAFVALRSIAGDNVTGIDVGADGGGDGERVESANVRALRESVCVAPLRVRTVVLQLVDVGTSAVLSSVVIVAE